jgi:hypothetical protein
MDMYSEKATEYLTMVLFVRAIEYRTRFSCVFLTLLLLNFSFGSGTIEDLRTRTDMSKFSFFFRILLSK